MLDDRIKERSSTRRELLMRLKFGERPSSQVKACCGQAARDAHPDSRELSLDEEKAVVEWIEERDVLGSTEA